MKIWKKKSKEEKKNGTLVYLFLLYLDDWNISLEIKRIKKARNQAKEQSIKIKNRKGKERKGERKKMKRDKHVLFQIT